MELLQDLAVIYLPPPERSETMNDIMKIMPGLIAEEAQDAMKYANLALEHQSDHPDLASMFIQLSSEELRHMKMISDKLAGMVNSLHDQYHPAQPEP